MNTPETYLTAEAVEALIEQMTTGLRQQRDAAGVAAPVIIGLHPQVKPSRTPYSVDDRHIILADDVPQTGRTIRAAMNEIFDCGQSASIILATLVERDTRELTIQAKPVGVRPSIETGYQITLTGPAPLDRVSGQSKKSARQSRP